MAQYRATIPECSLIARLLYQLGGAFTPTQRDMLRESPTFRFWCWLASAVSLSSCQAVRDDIFAVNTPAPSAAAAGTGGARPTQPQTAAGQGHEGSAGMNQAGSAGEAGRPAPADAGVMLDEDATFQWTETPPGGSGTCEAGTFTGSFSCDIPSILSSIQPQRVEGALAMTFDGDPGEAQVLQMKRGQLHAFDEATRNSFLVAPLEGMLNCSTRVMNAQLPATMSEVIPIDRLLAWGLLVLGQPIVSGVMRGTYDPRHLTIEGDLTLMLESVPCTGTFNVQATRQ